MISQQILDEFARGIADIIYRKIGKRVGYFAKRDDAANRVIFTFKADELSAHCTVPMEDLSKAHSWQGLSDMMVAKALHHLDPTVTFSQAIEPEVPVFIDQKQRRHFTMKADTGYLGLKLGRS